MASDKFGNNPVAPLYNATGRNPRDLDMGGVGKGLGSVGSSGGGGKDFGISNRPAQTQSLGQGMLSPFNMWGPNSMYQNTMGRNRPGRRGGGGGGGGGGGYTDADGREIDLEASLALTKAATPQTVSFGDQAGGNQANVGSRAQQGENSQMSGGDSAGNDVNKDNTLSQGLSAETKPVKVPRTAAQKQATAATRAEKKAANPAYGRRGTTPRPERGESPIARRRSAPSAPKSVTNEQSIGNLKQKSMGNF